MKNINYSFAIILLLLSACASKQTNIQGDWISQSAEPLGNGAFGKRQFSIKDKTWEVKFTLYLDSGATMPVFTLRGAGAYTLGAVSKKVEGATEAVFSFANKYITLHTSDTTLIKNFGFVACQLTPSQEKEITETGCSFLESKSACAQEYDVVSVKDEKLYFGKRPAAGKNLCTEENRPTELGLPLVKVK